MSQPVITARYDRPMTAYVDEVGFSLEEPPQQIHPNTVARFRKMLEFALPMHVQQHFEPGSTTPETVAACLESFLEHLSLEDISQLVWNTVDDHYSELDEEMPEA